jgi:hypothetical protein
MYVLFRSDSLIHAYPLPVSFVVSTLKILSVHNAFRKKETLHSLIFALSVCYIFNVPTASSQVLFIM